ncbi:MAG: hypothetical protein R3F59_24080 [Myxococcota bacterium]
MASNAPIPKGFGCLTTALPVVTAVICVSVGIAIGAGGTWIFKPAPPPIAFTPPSSLAALSRECEPLVAELERELPEVMGELEVVEAQLALKQQEVAAVAPKAGDQGEEPSAEDGRNYVLELAAAEKQLAELRVQRRLLERQRAATLDQIARVRERLLVPDEELANALAISDLLRDDRGVLVDVAVLPAWFGFVRESQDTVCGTDRTRAGLDCRAAVQRELSRVKADFVHCVRAGQPLPTVRHPAEDEAVPTFVRWMDPEDHAVAGWYTQVCDPALPEGALRGIPEVPKPPPRVSDVVEDEAGPAVQ